jgi:D-psicose/D-tagatose/L-ribulose 3-epimerase
MPRFGVHTFVWTPDWDRAGAETAISQAAAAGVDLVEVALLRPAEVDVAHSRELAARHGIALTCSLGLPPEASLPDHPAAAEGFLRQALAVTAGLGAKSLSGVTYGTIGRLTGQAVTEGELDIIAAVLRSVARHAAGLGLTLGLEPCNRYETHLVNTGRQAVSLIERIGEPNLFVHLDTYHMNIEEKGFAAAILDCGPHLRYIHLSESDRGTPGSGNVDWEGVFGGLARIGFDGDMVLESFVHLHPDIARALCVWRPVAPRGAAEVIGKGLPFLRDKARAHGLATTEKP